MDASVLLMDHAMRRNINGNASFSLPSSSSLTLDQQQKLLFLLNNHSRGGGGGGGVGYLQPGPRPSYVSQLPPPMHSSLPHGLLNQSRPPLLPLPFSRSSSLPSPVGAHRRTPRVHRKKPTLVPNNNRKEAPPPPPSLPTTSTQIIIKNPSTNEEEKEEVKEKVVDLYLLSPPPSSLPLPRFSLKPKGN